MRLILSSARQSHRLASISKFNDVPRLNIHCRTAINSTSRPFTTSRRRQASQDRSTIDFAYMPQFELEVPQHGEVIRAPLLPENSSAPRQVAEAPETVVRPEIATVSANGTHIDNPSAMSEVTDNHAIDISPFNLTSQVSNAATAAASKVTGMSEERLKEEGVLQTVWSGLLDDVLGEKKMTKV